MANNVKHGFRSSAVLLPGDDPAEYRLRRCREHLQSALTRHMATVAASNTELTGIDLQSRAIETLAETGCSCSRWVGHGFLSLSP